MSAALTVGELARRLLALPDQSAPVFNAHLFKDNFTLALLPVVGTAEKNGQVLLLDPDVYKALAAIKSGSN